MGFSPNGRFAFNRAYLAQWQIGIYPGWTLESADNPLIARNEYPGIGYQYLHFKVKNEVWLATSNWYTLDFVIERAWNTYSWFGGEYDTTYNVTWGAGVQPGCNALIFDAGAPTKFFAINAERLAIPAWIALPVCPEILT